MRQQRWPATALAAIAGLVLISACGGAASSQGTAQNGGATAPGVTGDAIQIGTSNALTGINATAAGQVSSGAQAVFDSVNAAGGIDGRRVQVNLLDDAYDATRAVANARTFVNRPVFAVFGGLGTVAAEAVRPLYEQEGIPYLFPYQGDVWQTNPSTFLLMPFYSNQTKTIIKGTLALHGKGSVYALFGKTAGTAQSIVDARTATEQSGGTFLGYDEVSQGTADYTPYVLRMKAAHPDYLLISTTQADSARYATAVVAQGALPAKRILGLVTLADETFVGAIPQEAADLVSAVAPNSPPASSQAAECAGLVRRYQPSARVTMDAIWGCATAQILVYGLRKAGANLTRTALQKAFEQMRDVNVTPVLPPVTFTSSNHQAERTMYEFTVKNRQLVVGNQVTVSS
jgi:branched-chain amino acid transport system substrate-binding protein